MTDVLIVCVREDEVQAKALADMFERAGFSVGGAPADDAALRASAAVVVVWSQASIRSRPFLEAAQRAVNVGKGVIASLIEPPPSSSLNQSPAFDLRGWRGDPEDPLLDPLYFAIDRMAGPPAAASEAPPEPPAPVIPLRPQPVAAPYASSPQPTYEPPPTAARRRAPVAAPGDDPMSAEALRWRAIRHSRDPASFLHYLAEYGPEGAFSELAELRLKQLQEANATPLKAVARAAQTTPRPRREPPPAPAQAPAPQPTAWREPEPDWHAPAPAPAPAPRREPSPQPQAWTEPLRPAYREPAAAPARREPPAEPAWREPPREERYARREADYAPPPPPRRTGGGIARGLILFVLLGGGAVAAGMYFGGGQRLAPEPPAFAAQDVAAPASETAPPAEASDQPALSLAEVSAVGGPSEPLPAASERSRPAAAPTPESVREVAAAPQRYEQPEREEAPVSLMPQPMAPTTRLASLEPPRRAPAPGAVVWARRPSGSQVADQYPTRAAQAGVAGRVELSCSIAADYAPSCTVASESPSGYGFGAAALRVSRTFRAAPALDDGANAAGAYTRLLISFAPAR